MTEGYSEFFRRIEGWDWVSSAQDYRDRHTSGPIRALAKIVAEKRFF